MDLTQVLKMSNGTVLIFADISCYVMFTCKRWRSVLLQINNFRLLNSLLCSNKCSVLLLYNEVVCKCVISCV